MAEAQSWHTGPPCNEAAPRAAQRAQHAWDAPQLVVAEQQAAASPV